MIGNQIKKLIKLPKSQELHNKIVWGQFKLKPKTWDLIEIPKERYISSEKDRELSMIQD